jgi:hypothetical protein
VKRFLKTSAVLSISVLYCFIISLYSGNTLNSSAFSKSTGTEFSASEVSSNLFCHTEQTESVTSVYNQVSRTSLKNAFNQFSACSGAAAKLLFKSYLPYFYISKNIVVRFNKTDIIFPFQYFW